MQAPLVKAPALNAATGETRPTARLWSTKRYATNSGAVRSPKARVPGVAMLMATNLSFVVIPVN